MPPTLKDPNPFVKVDQIRQDHKDAHFHLSRYMADFDDFERVAYNVLRSLPPELTGGIELDPVGDSTTYSLLRQKPRDILQRIPTIQGATPFRDLNTAATLACNQEILPNCNMQAKLYNKCLWSIFGAETYGSSYAVVDFRDERVWSGYSGPDFYLPSIRSLAYNADSLDEANVYYHSRYVRKRQLERLAIDVRKKQGDYDRELGYRLSVLNKIIKRTPTHNDFDLFFETLYQLPTDVVHLIDVRQKGNGARWYTVDALTGDVVRAWENPDPRGHHGGHQLHWEFDPNNPLGRGLIAGALPHQNALNLSTGSYIYTQIYNLNPAAWLAGPMPPGGLRFEMGYNNVSPNTDSRFEMLEINTDGIKQYPQTYGLHKSQILEFGQGSSTAIGAQAGNPQFSKTSPGVQAQVAQQNRDTRVDTIQFEGFFEDVCETMVNWYFGVGKGKREIPVSPADKRKIRDTFELTGAQDRALIEKDVLIIDFDQIDNKAIKMRVDAKSSSLADDITEANTAQALISVINDTDDPAFKDQFNLPALGRLLLEKSGISNPDDYLVSPDQQRAAEISLARQLPALVDELVNRALQARGVSPQAEILKALGINPDRLADDERAQLLQLAGIQASAGKSPTQQKIDVQKAQALAKFAERQPSPQVLDLLDDAPPPPAPPPQFNNDVRQVIAGVRSGLSPQAAVAGALTPAAA